LSNRVRRENLSGKITPRDVADLAQSGDIIGMTIRVKFANGKNSKHPVYFHFTDYSYPYGENNRYLDYILMNRNTEEYYYPKPFKFNARDFSRSWRDRHHYDYEEVKEILVIEGMPELPASDWEL
jgi:hypothetical protein